MQPKALSKKLNKINKNFPNEDTPLRLTLVPKESSRYEPTRKPEKEQRIKMKQWQNIGT